MSNKPSIATKTAGQFLTATELNEIVDFFATKPDSDEVESPAQLNARDAINRDRANHIGTQVIATILGLQAALDAKSPTGHGHPASEITGLPFVSFSPQDFEDLGGFLRTRGKDGELYAWQKLGCTIKAKPIGMNLSAIQDEWALVDGRIYLVPVFLNRTTTIASLGFIVNTEGVFTADNENRLAVYEDQAGVLTRVGITPNSDSIFTSTGAKTVNLTSPVSLIGDKIYWVAILYNNSAQTVAPRIGGDAYSLPFSFRDSFLPANTSAARFIAGATMPATIALSATTRSIEIPALFLI